MSRQWAFVAAQQASRLQTLAAEVPDALRLMLWLLPIIECMLRRVDHTGRQSTSESPKLFTEVCALSLTLVYRRILLRIGQKKRIPARSPTGVVASYFGPRSSVVLEGMIGAGDA